MSRKIYTKKESLNNTWKIIGMAIFTTLILVIGNFSWKNGIIYLTYLIMLGLGIWQTTDALKWRKRHQTCVETQMPQKGWIVGCVSETIYHYRGRGRRYIEYVYYLDVETYLPGLTELVTIRSDAYTWPVYQALSSPEVDVYYSDTEGGYTLDGFQYKIDRSEPDILPESLRKSLPDKMVDIWVTSILFTLLVITVLYRYYY